MDRDKDTCVYYDDTTGMRCAVGWAMSEKSAKFVTRTEPYTCVSTLFAHVIDCDKPDALSELQEAHDHGDRPREMRKRVKQWCERWGFEFKEPAKVGSNERRASGE